MTLETLILLVLCGVLGWQLHSFYMTYRMLGLMRRLALIQAEHEQDELVYNAEHVEITVVLEQGIYLVYDADNNFICQGANLAEVAGRFRDRTNNSVGEFVLDDKRNCFYDGEHLDHTQFKKMTVKS